MEGRRRRDYMEEFGKEGRRASAMSLSGIQTFIAFAKSWEIEKRSRGREEKDMSPDNPLF